MADYVSIANLAVGFLGEDDQLTSPDDDTHVGRTIKAAWELSRRAAIRGHTWNFAIRFAQLTAQADLAAADLGGWGYSFPLPAASLRLVKVDRLSENRDFRIAGKSILCNSAGPLNIEYLIDVPDTSNWDDSFVVVMARRLAYQCADRITGDRARKLDAQSEYRSALADAKRVDAVENPGPIEALSPWEEARLAGGGWNDFCGYRSGTGPYTPA